MTSEEPPFGSGTTIDGRATTQATKIDLINAVAIFEITDLTLTSFFLFGKHSTQDKHPRGLAAIATHPRLLS